MTCAKAPLWTIPKLCLQPRALSSTIVLSHHLPISNFPTLACWFLIMEQYSPVLWSHLAAWSPASSAVTAFNQFLFCDLTPIHPLIFILNKFHPGSGPYHPRPPKCSLKFVHGLVPGADYSCDNLPAAPL